METQHCSLEDDKMKFSTMAVTSTVLIVLILAGCFGSNQHNSIVAPYPKDFNVTKCGDGFCAADESCKTCPQDCGCGSGYCNKYGICETVICGDGICSDGETCPRDCGCPSGKVLNDSKCVDPPKISDKQIEDKIRAYSDSMNLSYEKIVSVSDSIYAKKYAKAVIFATKTGTEYLAYLDSDLNVLGVSLNQ